MSQDIRKDKKRFKKRWLILLFLCAGVTLFYKPLLLMGCKAILNSAIPKSKGRAVAYEKMQWENGVIVISHLQVKGHSSELIVDRIELQFKGDFFHLCLKPQVTVVHPQIVLSSAGSQAAPALPFLYRTAFVQPRWEIKNGVMQLPSSSRFYFSMKPGSEEDAIGSILCSSDPSPLVPPMISADLAMRDHILQVGFKLHESELSRLLPLTALIDPKIAKEWEKTDGEVEFEGLVCFDSALKIQELHCQGAGKNIDLKGPAMGIDVQSKEIKVAFSYPVAETSGSFWDKLSASLYLQNGSCHLGSPLINHPLGMSALVGELTFEPAHEPKLTLSGTLIQDEQQMPFALLGKGGMQEDRTFWSEIELNCNSMQALLSFCSYEGGDLALHLKVDNAAFKHLDFFRGFCALPGQCVEGMASAEATLVHTKGSWQKASVEHVQLSNIRWYFPHQQITIFAEHISADSAFEKKNNIWVLDDLHLQMNGGDYLDPGLHLESLSTEFAIEKGILHPSQIKGEWGTLQAEVSLLSAEGTPSAHLKLQGDGKELLSLLAKKQGKTSLPIELLAEAKIEKGNLQVDAAASIAGDPVHASALFSLASVSIPEMLLGQLPNIQFKEGQFQAEALSEKSYGAILSLVSPDIKMSGNVQCKSTFTPSRFQLQLGGDDVIVKHSTAQLFLPQLKEKTAQFTYDSSKGQWRGEIPLVEAKLHYQELGLDFVNVEGSLKLEGDHLKVPAFYAECEGLALRGNLDFSLKQGQLSLATSQIAGDMKSLALLLSHFPALPKMKLPIEGQFSSGDKGLVLNSLGGGTKDVEWSFKGSFDNLRFPMNPTTAITNGRCEVQFDSKTQRLSVEKGEGIWQLKDGMPFTLQVKRFSSQLNDATALDFAFKIVDGKREFAHFEGKAIKTPKSQFEITFDRQATHFGGTQLNITRCSLSDSLKLIAFEMRPVLKAQDLHAQAALLQNAGFLPPNFSPKNIQEWQIEGTLQAKMSSEDLTKGFAFIAESNDLKIKGKFWSSFHVSGQKIGEKWLIEKLEAGSLSLKAAFIVDDDGLSFPQFEGSLLGMRMKGSGYLKSKQKRFSCTFESLKGDLAALELFPKIPAAYAPRGTFTAGVSLAGDFSDPLNPLRLAGEANLFIDLQAPLPITASNVKTLKFTYGKTSGLVCEGLDFQIKHRATNAYLAGLKIGKVFGQEGGDLSLGALQFSMTSALFGHCIDAKIFPASMKEMEWEGSLEGNGDALIGAKGNVFQGTLKSGRYGFGGKSLPFDQLHVRYEKDSLMIRAKAKIEEQPLWGSLQIDLVKEPFGVIKLLDNPKAEGMKLIFSTLGGKTIWESIQGSCYGMTCALTKSAKRKVPLASVLSGEIKVDGKQVCALLPEKIRNGMESFKFGSGYQWQGDLVLWQEAHRGFQANGTLQGSEFEAFGYRFRHLEGTMDANAEHVSISNVKIDDPAGTVSINKIELNKQEEWQLYIPQVMVRQLQPSLMRKLDGEVQVVKPFTIKNFTMSEIRGRLGDKSTLEGSGHLSFVNQFKKESSLLDIPLEMIKKIGLDPGLLTPVQGELEMELRGDKFYLLGLLDSFSEGNRAEFYLAPNKDLSYIDLDGKVHIDLNMRQDVMLKITEPFTLTIRGTLDKPRYGLQY